MDSETVGKVNEECKEGLPEKCTGRRRMRPKERKARACEQAGECQHSKVKGDDGCWCVQGVGKVVLEEQARFFCELVVRQWQGLHDESTKSGKKTTHTHKPKKPGKKKEACRLHCSSSKTPADADAKNRRGCLVVCRTKKKNNQKTNHTNKATGNATPQKKQAKPNHLRHTFCCDDGMSPNQHSCTNNRKALAAPEADFRFVACCCSNNRQGKFSKRFQPLFCVLCSVTRGKLTEVAHTILQDTQRHCWWRRTHSKQVEHEMTQLAPSTVWKMTTKRHSTNYTIWARNCNCATQHKANFASCSSAPKKFELVLAQ